MSDFLAGLLGALLATNQPVALSNVIAQHTGVSIPVVDKNDPVEGEFQRIMEEDDRAQAEVDEWIKENERRQSQGDHLGSLTLKARINQRFEPVKKAYLNFLGRHPNHARARLAYGCFLSDIAEEDAAHEQFQKAVEVDPKNPAAWNNLANYYGHKGPVAKAFECYGKALELRPSEAVYYQNLATTMYLFRRDATNYFRISEPEVFVRSVALYRRAMELDPGNFVLATDFAQTYYGIPAPKTRHPDADKKAADQYADDAVAAWRHAASITNDEKERQGIQVHIARVQINAGRLEEARKTLVLLTNEFYAPTKERMLKRIQNLATKAAGTNTPSTDVPANQ